MLALLALKYEHCYSSPSEFFFLPWLEEIFQALWSWYVILTFHRDKSAIKQDHSWLC